MGKLIEVQLHRFDGKLWGHHVLIPNSYAEQFITKDRRVICILENNFSFQCALIPQGNGDYFINLNAEIRKKFQLKEGQSFQLQLKNDESKYGFPISEEFQILLEQDLEGSILFHQLTPGKQRSLLHIIGKPKSEALRLHKAITILNYLKLSNGKLDFKELNQAIKDFPFSN